LVTVDFGCVGCRRPDPLRGFAGVRDDDVVFRPDPEAARLRLLVPFRLPVRPPDADRVARRCGFLLAIVRLSSMWGVCDPYPNQLQGNRCKLAVNANCARPTESPSVVH
jgi:hypothetical protein